MLDTDYTNSWDRYYRGVQHSTIHEEFNRFQVLVDEHDLDESLFEIKALDEAGTLQRHHRYDAMGGLDEEQIYAVAAEYEDDEKDIRLEYDRNPILGNEFKLYMEGDELFRVDVTAAMDIAPEPTWMKSVRDILP